MIHRSTLFIHITLFLIIPYIVLLGNLFLTLGYFMFTKMDIHFAYTSLAFYPAIFCCIFSSSEAYQAYCLSHPERNSICSFGWNPCCSLSPIHMLCTVYQIIRKTPFRFSPQYLFFLLVSFITSHIFLQPFHKNSSVIVVSFMTSFPLKSGSHFCKL